MSGRSLAGVVLFLLAALSGWWVWRLQADAAPPPLVGPPRSDYLLHDFSLIALDADGRESFAASGPRLTRHPGLGTLDVEQPRFSSPDANGDVWNSRAQRAWVSRDGSEVRLLGNAEVIGPAPAAGDPIRMVSDLLVLFPRTRLIETDLPVTVTEPGSILQGSSLRADIDARRVQLTQVRIQHEPRAR